MDYGVVPCIRVLLRNTPLAGGVTQPMERLFYGLYQLLWVFPAYFISFLVSCAWYQDIANRAYELHFGKRPAVQPNLARFMVLVRDEAWRFLLTYSFLVQTYAILYLLPVVGGSLFLAHLCWYWAFFCYEYKWALHGWTIDDRVCALEQEWAFLAGFGTPLALMSALFPAFVSYGVVAFVFPLFVVLATISEPRRHVATRWAPARLPIFYVSTWASLAIVRTLSRKFRPGRARPGQGAKRS